MDNCTSILLSLARLAACSLLVNSLARCLARGCAKTISFRRKAREGAGVLGRRWKRGVAVFRIRD